MNLSHAVAVVLAPLFAARCEQRGLSDLGIERAGAAMSPAVAEGLQPVSASELDALLSKARSQPTARQLPVCPAAACRLLNLCCWRCGCRAWPIQGAARGPGSPPSQQAQQPWLGP
jgi:hypothetical protein